METRFIQKVIIGLVLLLPSLSPAKGFEFAFQQYIEGQWTEVACKPQRFCRNKIRDVYCLDDRTCWAVGRASNNRATIMQLDLVDKKETWKISDVDKSVGKVDLRAIHCSAKDNCLAVGRSTKPGATVLLYNGKKWSRVNADSVPPFHLNAVYCVGKNNCYVAGIRSGLHHWNGKKWTTYKLSKEKDTSFEDIVCNIKSECKIIGNFRNKTVVYQLKEKKLSKVISDEKTQAFKCLRTERCLRKAGITKVPKPHTFLNKKNKWVTLGGKVPPAIKYSRGVYCHQSKCFMW